MEIIGRKTEQNQLTDWLNSGKPEFVAVYGRRRIGKTYLIKEYFKQRFSFYTTGVANLKMKEQLRLFGDNLRKYGSEESGNPCDWFDAFRRLQELIESGKTFHDPVSGRAVVFIDELPWMDSPRSNFKEALDYFWNSYASSKPDIFLIVCGSATSWIIKYLLSSRGGLHNRVTRQIDLKPFTLQECEEYFRNNGIVMTRHQIIENYMVFGGIPYYLDLLDRRMSLAQNIDVLCFTENGQLRYEFERLYASLFRNSDRHMEIIRVIAKAKSGTTRAQLASNPKIGDGEALTEALSELCQCGFIRKYKDFGKSKRGFIYQVIDPYTLFYLDFIESEKVQSWLSHIDSPGYYSWAGYAFELVCLLHTNEIKKALGISGIETMVSAWKSRKIEGGAQIDMLIDRKDGVINVCEMKFSQAEYEISDQYEKNIRNKLEVFRKESKTRKALHTTMITSNGLYHNEHSQIVVKELSANDFFQH